MSCPIIRRHLDAFVDGELDPTSQIEIERHVMSCAECQEALEFERSFRKQTREAVVTHTAPTSLRAKIEDALDHEDRARSPLAIRVFSVKHAGPLAAAAVLLLVVASPSAPALSFGNAVQSSALPMLEDVVRLHSTNLPADVEGPAPQVTSFFRDKVHFPVHPPEFVQQPARLVRARVTHVRERTAAALYYDLRGQRVTVVVFEAPQPIEEEFQHTTLNGRDVGYELVRGYTVPVLRQGSLTYALTGDLDRQELLRLASTARVSH